MTVRLDGDIVRLEGACRVEDAEPLSALLQAGNRTVDLSQCRQAHSAVLQALLAFSPALAAEPPDPLLRDLVRAAGLVGTEVQDDRPAPPR